MVSFSVIFLFCVLGEQFSGRLDEINDVISSEISFNSLNRKTFPLSVQQMMTMILLIITQHPMELMSYGGVPCMSVRGLTNDQRLRIYFGQLSTWHDKYLFMTPNIVQCKLCHIIYVHDEIFLKYNLVMILWINLLAYFS